MISRGDPTSNRDAPVYFPGTIDLKAAASIDVAPGADYPGADFTLLHEKGRELRGVILDAKGQPARAAISLSPRDRSGMNESVTGAQDSAGQFTITGVLPGSYLLSARTRVENERQTGGHILVDVRDSNLDGLTVVLSPGVDIEGQLFVEGTQTALDPNNHPVITLETRNAQGMFAAVEGALFSDNGRFRMPGVVEGEYEPRVYQLKPDQYISSIRSGTVDVLTEGFRVDAASTRLDVVIGSNGGSIDGVVINQKHEPESEARVTLIPDAARRQRPDLYKNATTNDSGRFQIQGIAPGLYTLLTWDDDIEEGAWLDPEFLTRLEGRGTRIRIDAGSKSTVELNRSGMR
jgi:hypothetical protein